MAKSLKQWLGSFVDAELEAVLNWNHSIQKAPKIKDDPDSRFSDDGSNFRSTVGSPPLTMDSKIQLIKVLSISNPATVLLSDGGVCIKAILSEEAIAVLEDELEEKLSLDMKGDILSLAQVTVVSTPYGPADGHVQLFVDDWQYQYHLRKVVGDPQSVEKQRQTRQFLETIKEVRTQQCSIDEIVEDALREPMGQEVESSSRVPRHVNGGRKKDLTREDARSSPTALPSMPPLSVSQSQPQIATQAQTATQAQRATQAQIATQAQMASQPPPRKKPRLSSFEKEGVEIEKGVNLSRPSGPNLSSAPARGPATKSARQATVSADLLNLLGARIEGPTGEGAALVSADSELEALTGEDAAPVSVDRDMEAGMAAARELSAAASQTSHVRDASPHVRTPANEDLTNEAVRRSSYARRKIPSQQQRLFEKEGKQAWFPSLPGYTFPMPNVPIELLQSWTVQPSLASEASPQQSSGEVPGLDNAQRSAAASDGEESTDTSDSSSDEEVPLSQWPPSPTPPKRAMLPPDSTIGSGEVRMQAVSPQELSQPSPAKQPSLPSSSPYEGSSESPRFASIQQERAASPQKPPRHSPAKAPSLPSNSPYNSGGESPRFANSQHQQAVGPQKPPRPSPAKLPGLLTNSPSQVSSQSPRSANTQQAPLRSPVKQHPLPKRPPPSTVTSAAADGYIASYAPATPNGRLSAGGYDDRTPSLSARNAVDRHDPAHVPSRQRRQPISSLPQVDMTNRREHPNRDLATPRRPERRPHSPRSSGQDTVIKGTQFSTNGEDMEMDVPRQLLDPAVLHRQRRSEHFQALEAQKRERQRLLELKEAERKEAVLKEAELREAELKAAELKAAERKAWLQANYIVSYEAAPYISTVHQTYLAAHPEDDVAIPEFKQTVAELYPTLLRKGHAPRSLVLRKDAPGTAPPSPALQVPRVMDSIEREAVANALQSKPMGPPTASRPKPVGLSVARVDSINLVTTTSRANHVGPPGSRPADGIENAASASRIRPVGPPAQRPSDGIKDAPSAPRSSAVRNDAAGASPPSSVRNDAASASRPSSVRPISRPMNGINDAPSAPPASQAIDLTGETPTRNGPRPSAVGRGSQSSSQRSHTPGGTPTRYMTSFALQEQSKLRASQLQEDAEKLNQQIEEKEKEKVPRKRKRLPEQESSEARKRNRGAADLPNGTNSPSTTNETAGAPVTEFEAFQHAWKNIRPGGAFARPQHDRVNWGDARAMDVLSWGVKHGA